MYILLLTFYLVALYTFVVAPRCAPTLAQKGEPQNGMTVNGRPRKCRVRIGRSTGQVDCARKERKRERERETNLTCPKIVARYERARIQMDTDERAKAGTRHPLVVAISSWWNFTPSGAGYLPRPSVTIILTAIFSYTFKETPERRVIWFFFFLFRL